MYDRTESTGIAVIDRWENGFGWLAHPDERARRASHAISGDDGVWLFDPLDGPGIDDRLAELGTAAGVAVLSSFHARDAVTFADRHDVAIHLPRWMDRVAERVSVSTARYAAPPGEWAPLGQSGISVRTVDPMTAWREALAYDPSDGTLRVPDMLSTVPQMTVGDERLGWYLVHRFAPPRSAFSDVDPERILVGHGEGIFDDAGGALVTALENGRRNLPHALVSQTPHQIRGVLGAVRG